MKIILGGNDLADAVSKVLYAVSANSPNPILEGIKLSATSGSLTLTATNLELSIEKTIAADVKIEGETVVPGRLFGDFVKRLNKEQIELALDEGRLKIKYGDSEGVLQCHSAAEFPQIAQLDGGHFFIVIRSEFKDLINKTSFSAAKDDSSRPILKGILLEADTVSLTAVTLDGYRLAKCQKPLEKSSGSFNAVVPYRSLEEAVKLIDDSPDPMSVTVEKNYLKADLGHTIITSRLLEGEYINYNQIIPSDFSSAITVSCGQFASALERAVLLAKTEKNNLVKFDIKGQLLTLLSNSDKGCVDEKVPAILDGADLFIAFNARYFTELLRHMDSENMIIKFTGSVSPCIIEPAEKGSHLIYLVLPVRIIE